MESLLERPEHLEQQVGLEEIRLNPKQTAFVKSKAMYCAYGGGVGNGKTLSALIKVYMHCMDNPGAYFLIGRKFYPELRDSTMRDFLKLMKNYGTFRAGDKTFEFPNGSQVIFRHLDNQDSLTNLNLSGFYVDQAEDIPEETFDYLSGRVRLTVGSTGLPIKERMRLITFNPKGHDYIWRLFDQKKNPEGYDLANPEDYFMVVATTFENQHNLAPEYIKSLENKPKIWKDRFMYGSFDAKAGRIFEEFNPALHVIQPENYFAIPEAWERVRAIDHGQNNPTACLWAAIDFDGNMWIYDEYYRPNDTVSNHVRYIKDKSGQVDKGLTYTYTVIDPSTAAKTREKDGMKFSVAHEYMDAGIFTVPGQNDVVAGINRVQEYFKPDEKRMHPFLYVRDLKPGHPLYKINMGRDEDQPVLGSPRVFIFAKCKNLIEELPEYEWQPLKYNQIGLQNSHEKPVKNNDHATDACFVAGTLVRTDKGSLPIESLRVGDKALTRQGYRVIDAVFSNGIKEVFSVKLSNGSTLVGTANHPIWVEGKGFTPLSELRYGDMMRTWTTQTNTDGSLDNFGVRIMAQFQKATKYITRMATSLTTLSPTWNVSQGTITTNFTGSKSRFSKRFAPNAGATSKQSSLLPSSALITASPSLAVFQGSTIPSELALSAASTSLPTSIPRQDFALNFVTQASTSAKTLWQRVKNVASSGRQKTAEQFGAPLSVASVTPVGKRKVYNLTVSGPEEYFAGGVLVHNCRYLIMSRPVAPEHAQQIDPGIWQDPLQLAMYAKRNNTTVDDLVARRFRFDGQIRKREGGIKTRSKL